MKQKNTRRGFAHCCFLKGFTLIELLVVVIIIAVLSAVALPMYKHAALKSRFSKVMPVAKSIVEAQEVYYLGKNIYAANDEKDLLDVSPSGDTTIELATREQENRYNYVAASRADVPGVRYIMYQKHSPRFAGNIHCEADANNPEALWLCEKGLKGTFINGNVADNNAITYVLEGTRGENDVFVKECPPGGETRACACGSGTESGTCNTQTGVWEYAGGSCPVAPQSQTYTCGQDDSSFTLSYRCNEAGTGYEPYYSAGACEYSTDNGHHSAKGDYYNGATFSGQSEYCVDSSSSSYDFCNQTIFAGLASRCQATAGSNGCNNAVFEGVASMCEVGGSASGKICNNGTFIGTNSTCATYDNNGGCNGGTFIGEGAKCRSGGVYKGGCNNSTFKAGTHCEANVANSCSLNETQTNYEQGSWCQGNYCPVGTPKRKYVDGEYVWSTWRECEEGETGYGVAGRTC